MYPLLRFTGAVDRDPNVDLWFDQESPELSPIARRWFAVMRESGSDVRELIHDGCPVACVEDAPFGYVDCFKAHVNIGFFHGASLPDPTGLLQGNGKYMRHVKARPGDEPDAAALDALINAAYEDILVRLKNG